MLFDFAQMSNTTTRDLLIVLGVAGWLSWWTVFSSANSMGMRIAAALVVIAMVGGSIFHLGSIQNRFAEIQSDITSHRVSEVEGRVVRVRRGGASVYLVANQELRTKWRYPALDVEDEWMDANLLGRCARIRLTRRDDIIWVGVRDFGCATVQ